MNRNTFLIALSFILLFLFSRCKNDDDMNGPTPNPDSDPVEQTMAEKRFNLLKDKIWVLGTVQHDGTIITNEFEGFNIIQIYDAANPIKIEKLWKNYYRKNTIL